MSLHDISDSKCISVLYSIKIALQGPLQVMNRIVKFAKKNVCFGNRIVQFGIVFPRFQALIEFPLRLVEQTLIEIRHSHIIVNLIRIA
ncbi:hypothetical protein AMJ83_03260 [candidate division WOR_3 bacterium SM23_42]|uniref:Uncharacterized protein n=1 Tax=candidate division WOR_3 bacterium SM23_42 TaxID=1703779 RepID=A0A0S8FW17_UNCW3|nr:MAG: hypothetical protein AMJ83_03260 [candidate division WOR_3 bacterium SM23_42]